MQAARLLDHLDADAALLRSRGSAEENSDRLNAARETVARMRSQFGRFGITRLAEVTGLDRIGIPVWMAIRPNSKTLAVSQGKGLNDPAAQASAVMEAAELATAERCAIPVHMSSLQTLGAAGEHAIALDQFLSRGEKPLAESDVVPWVEGFDLLRGHTAFVPADLVTLDPAGKTGNGSRYWQTSDGLASGNILLEAVVHGLCERIERDACVLSSFHSDQDIFERCIDPSALCDEAVLSLAAQVDRSGFQLRLFDLTSDIRVPVYLATIAPKPDGREDLWKHFDLSSGSGCHPLPARAAIRAITEAAQSRVTSITGARDDFDPNVYGAQLKADLTAYLRASPIAQPRTSLEDVPTSAQNLDFILDRLRSAGIGSAIAVPLASEDGFAVARILLPDLENPPGNRRQRFGKRALKAMTT